MERKFDALLEELSRLYLRLNGFVVQNLIIHSNQNGQSCGEMDIIAMRLPLHSQLDTGNKTSDLIEASKDRIQIIIGDCKNYKKKEALEFSPIRKSKNCIIKLIRWIGISENPSEELIDKFEYFLNIHRDKTLTGFPSLQIETDSAKIDIKFIFFCPSLNEWNGQGFKYIHGQEMINYIWTSLNKVVVIDDCSRTYNYENWNNYVFLVRYFKERNEPGSIQDLKQYFELELKQTKKSFPDIILS